MSNYNLNLINFKPTTKSSSSSKTNSRQSSVNSYGNSYKDELFNSMRENSSRNNSSSNNQSTSNNSGTLISTTPSLMSLLNTGRNNFIKGDANNDGKVDELDRESTLNYIRRKTSNINMKAVDFNSDGKITVSDLSELNKLISENGEKVLAGDANNDGKVDIKDAQLTAKYIVGRESSINMKAVDFDGNGKITTSDLEGVMNIINKQNQKLAGDMNNDGKLDESDAIVLASHVVDTEKITDTEILKRADINGDGKVDLNDAKQLSDKVGAKDLSKIIDESGQESAKITTLDSNINQSLGAGGSSYYIKGDVNGDGVLDISDTIAIKMHIVKLKEITNPNAIRRGDFDGDGKIGVIDLSREVDTQLGLMPKEYIGQYIRTMTVDTQVVSDSGYLLGTIKSGTDMHVLKETSDYYLAKWSVGNDMWMTAWVPKNEPIYNLKPMEQTVECDLIGFSDPSFSNVSFSVKKGFKGTIIGEYPHALQLSDGQITVWIPKQLQNVRAGTPIYNDNGNYLGKFNVDSTFTSLYEDDNWFKGIWIESKNADGTFNWSIGWIPKNQSISNNTNGLDVISNYNETISKISDVFGYDMSSFNFIDNAFDINDMLKSGTLCMLSTVDKDTGKSVYYFADLTAKVCGIMQPEIAAEWSAIKAQYQTEQYERNKVFKTPYGMLLDLTGLDKQIAYNSNLLNNIIPLPELLLGENHAQKMVWINESILKTIAEPIISNFLKSIFKN